MKRFLKAFVPPGIFIVPAVLFAFAVAVMPTKPDTTQWLSAAEVNKDSISDRDAKVIFIGIAVAAGVVALIFFLPTTVAGLRDAPSYIGILIVNIVGGPFLIGWIAALIWSFVDRKPQPVVVQNIYQAPSPATPSAD